MQNNNKLKLSEIEYSYERYTDEVTQSKIHKHLTDINDTISAQDILNVNTNISSKYVSKRDNNVAEEFSYDITDKDDTQNKKEQVPSTWNVLDL